MRVLHCLRAPVGGLFRHVRDLAVAQAERGLEVGVICDARSGDKLTARRLGALEPHLALGLHRVPMSRGIDWRDLTAFAAVRNLVAMLEVDVIHGHGAKGGAYARLAARALVAGGRSICCFYTPHGGSLHYDPATLEGRLYIGLERRLAPLTDGIVFESAYAARIYGARIGSPAGLARVVWNGLWPEEFAAHRPRRDAAEFLFVGELRLLKGVDLLLDALAELRGETPVTATIIGEGPDGAAFRLQARERGLEASVRFLPPMPAPEAFPLGRALVVPSRAESLPYIVLEAAAAGVPLITSDAGGVPDIIADTKTPLFPAGDSRALAAAMRTVLAAPDLALSRALRLKTRVAQHFTVAGMAGAIIAFYAEAGALTEARSAITVA